MRTAIAIVAGVALLLLGLVITAPATIIDGRLDAATDGRVRLADTTGTIWNGAGTLRVAQASGAIDIAWRVEPLPLLWGELRGTLVSGDDVSPKAAFVVSRASVDLRDAALSFPADTLLRAAGAPALVGAGGTLALRSPAIGMSGEAITGQAALRWDDATLSMPGTALRIALGEVHFDGTGQGRWLSGALANTGGEVEIAGTAGLSADGAPRVNATLRLRGGIDGRRTTAIALALGLIGRPSGDGGFMIVVP